MIVEMTTIAVVLDGIDFIITMIYLRSGLRMYYEVQRKISFIHIFKQYDTHGVLKTLNQTKKAYDNASSLNDVSRLNQKPTNKKNNPSIYMKRFYSYVMDCLEARELRRIEKRERKRTKFQMRLEKHHKAKAMKKDKEDELVLKAEGNVRCPHCEHYTAPEQLLQDIATKACEKATVLLFSPEKVAHLKNLILNDDKCKPTKVEDFDEFKKVFYKLVVSCRECRISFDDPAPNYYWRPSHIVYLQSKRASQSEVTLKDSYQFVK
jgi:hypothetical protein